MPAPVIVMPGQAPGPLNVVGEKITVLASSEQTGGYEIFLKGERGPYLHFPPF
jgi:hypothetical protein